MVRCESDIEANQAVSSSRLRLYTSSQTIVNSDATCEPEQVGLMGNLFPFAQHFKD